MKRIFESQLQAMKAPVDSNDVIRKADFDGQGLKKTFVSSGLITLSNSQVYPLNSTITAPVSVSISAKSTTNYAVSCTVEAATGNVGDIKVSNKLTNGFKLSFNGGASSATIRWSVFGD